MNLNFPLTIAAFFAGAAVCLFCGWKGAQAAHPRRGVRMTPYRFLMLLAAAFSLTMLVHLLNLMGLTTGNPASR